MSQPTTVGDLLGSIGVRDEVANWLHAHEERCRRLVPGFVRSGDPASEDALAHFACQALRLGLPIGAHDELTPRALDDALRMYEALQAQTTASGRPLGRPGRNGATTRPKDPRRATLAATVASILAARPKADTGSRNAYLCRKLDQRRVPVLPSWSHYGASWVICRAKASGKVDRYLAGLLKS